eukprot:TRINITY_DN1116_c0_g1_i6.p1 TRINITY_DN1116_c0_g1~~TRINITY_DN1116_c0_g1_i6.p1  ORF type:complete len:184 (+),score=40.07 TRINITY_DN1116_c0_g1_i6:148-699(+)
MKHPSNKMPLHWRKVEGSLLKVSVGKDVWGVNDKKEIWRFDNSSNTWHKQPGHAVHISSGSDGTVWCINENDEVFSWNGRDWHKMPGSLCCVSIGNSQHIWGCNRFLTFILFPSVFPFSSFPSFHPSHIFTDKASFGTGPTTRGTKRMEILFMFLLVRMEWSGASTATEKSSAEEDLPLLGRK